MLLPPPSAWRSSRSSVTMAFGRPVLAAFPWAGLGAVVVYAATRLVDTAELRRIAKFRRSEMGLALATLPTAVAAYEQWLRDHPASVTSNDQAPLVSRDQSPDD